MHYRYINSPIGQLLLAGEDDTLMTIGFPEGKGVVVPADHWELKPDVFQQAEDQLGEYFSGRRTSFDLDMRPQGTPFQLSVLDALCEIPFGQTASYRDIAISIGKPKAVRAVGAANGRNPLPIVIPCHRVIGSNGSLTGFGGGLEAKSYLLNLEASGFSLN